MIDREACLKWAECFDGWRVVPRFLLFGYCGWAFHVVDKIIVWYTHLTPEAQNLQNAGMVTGVITAVTGFGVPIFRIYTENGRNWSGPPANVPTVNAP